MLRYCFLRLICCVYLLEACSPSFIQVAAELSDLFAFLQMNRQADRWKDEQTDGETSRQTDNVASSTTLLKLKGYMHIIEETFRFRFNWMQEEDHTGRERQRARERKSERKTIPDRVSATHCALIVYKRVYRFTLIPTYIRESYDRFIMHFIISSASSTTAPTPSLSPSPLRLQLHRVDFHSRRQRVVFMAY